jgi:phosphatidylserine/phosphatidylglycerophosphate/cardiolipin synthase-like enzyme
MAEIASASFCAFPIEGALPLHGRHYYYFLRRAVESANYRIWASIFIVSVTRQYDVELEVRDLVSLLSYKRSLGVDVRLILGDSHTTPSIHDADAVATRYLKTRRIPVRQNRGEKKSTHSKYVLIDGNLSIIGSHNWTTNAFSISEEDSIAVYSPEITRELDRDFLSNWMALKHETDLGKSDH